MNARFYVVALGQFASADTIVPEPGNPQSLNRYAYVGNNPVKCQDPTGHYLCEDLECKPPISPNYSLDDSRYWLVNGSYFDTKHVNSGARKANEILGLVTRAVRSGGGTFPLEDGFAGQEIVHYRANYTISDQAREEDILRVALAIFVDFSFGKEHWQGQVGFGLGRRTALSIEGPSSKYVGFFAATHDSYEAVDVLAAIGPMSPAGEPPQSSCLGPSCERFDLKNWDFTELAPKREINGRWVNVPWPEEIQMTPNNDGALWQFNGGYCCILFVCVPVN